MSSSTSAADVAGGNPLDAKYYLRVFLRRKWVVLGFFVLTVGAVAAWAVRQPKVYEGRTSVIIDVTAPRVLDSQVQDVSENASFNYWLNREYYETQHRVITSRAVSQRVVDKLGLQQDPAFLRGRPGDDATARLMEMIKVNPVKDSRVVHIVVSDVDPNRAALLANEIADAYIAENISLKLKIAETAMQWLDERRASLEEKSKSSELALYSFKKSSDMLTTSLEDRQSMLTQRLVALNGALTDVRLEIAGLTARVEAIRSVQKAASGADSRRWAEAIPAAKESAVVQQLKLRYVQQSSECAELKDRYFDQHPRLSGCLEKLAAAEGDLLRELNNLVLAADAELREAAAKERQLAALFDSAKAEAFDVNKRQIEFDEIKREADNNQRLYELVLKRLKDIELSGLLRTSNVRILDAARPDLRPVRPNIQNALLVALVIGLLGGFGLALLLEVVDTSITTQADIEERVGLTFLGFIPTIARDPQGGAASPDLHIHREPKSTVAECCRSVRTNLFFMSPDKPLKTLLVTSSGPQEGKSATVINLGIAFAQSGSRVLLIDTDMRRPRLHRAFGVPNEVGVSSLIVDEGSLDDAIKSTEVPNLFVMPCGPIPPNPAELLHTRSFAELLRRVGERFDRIILDSPPIGAVSDAVVLSTRVDGVTVVLKGGATNREVARRAVRALRDVNANVFGAVLNDIDLQDSKYGEYHSYRRYGYYYLEKEETSS